MNILQPTLCVILFHAFESSIIFEKTSFYGSSGRPRAAQWNGFREDIVSGGSLQTLRTIATDNVQGLNFTASQKKDRSFVRYVKLFDAVYENSVMAVNTVVVISFSNILLKLVV